MTSGQIKDLGFWAYNHRRELGAVLGKVFRRKGKQRKAVVRLYVLLARLEQQSLASDDAHAELSEIVLELDPKGKGARDAAEVVRALQKVAQDS